MLNPNASEIYAGLAGANLPFEEFDFGHGVVIRKTYAHIMAPYLAAFAPAEPGKPHPAPWKAVSGGLGFDIEAELHIPLSYEPQNGFDRVNTVWWLLALIRLRASPLATVPVISSAPFSRIPEMDEEPHFWPVEMEPRRLVCDPKPPSSIDMSSLEWIRQYWISAGSLMSNNEDFNVAFQAADESVWTRSSALALVALWGALERLFAPGHQELRFRVSTSIASYLEPPGEERLSLYKSVKRLYDARSRAAHGASMKNYDELIHTYALVKRVLTKMIERNHVPSHEELEVLLLGKDGFA